MVQNQLWSFQCLVLVYFSFQFCLGEGSPVFCPPLCLCDETSLSCPNASLTAVPLSDATENLRLLNLSRNRIAVANVSVYKNLASLDISWNNIISVASVQVSNLSLLEFLNLDGNRVGRSLRVHGLRIASGLKDLRISNIRLRDLNHLQFDQRYFIVRLNADNNDLTVGPSTEFLSHLPNLTYLSLSGNLINGTYSIQSLAHLRHLNISNNNISELSVEDDIPSLQVLDVSNNRILYLQKSVFDRFPNLETLNISGNSISFLPDGIFSSLTSLKSLYLEDLAQLSYIGQQAFAGLNSIRSISLARCSNLRSIHFNAFQDLIQLQRVDLSSSKNLIFALPSVFLAASDIVFELSDSVWPCDCRITRSLLDDLNHLSNNGRLQGMPRCFSLTNTLSYLITDFHVNETACNLPRIINSHNEVLLVSPGSATMMDCMAVGAPFGSAVWFKDDRLIGNYSDCSVCKANETESFILKSENDSNHETFIKESGMPSSESCIVSPVRTDSLKGFRILENGSLLIPKVKRYHAGFYKCKVVSDSMRNDTIVIQLRLDFTVISTVAFQSIMIGFMSSAAMFLIAVVIGILRYMCRVYSLKERRKRRSIREVLESLQDYKSTQLDRFSAYRTAKWDRLSALKAATVNHFSEIGHRRIDKLRTYRQATVASILAHMDKLREHYASQAARVKENCTVHAEHLRESYCAKRGRFKDYRSHQVERIRDNYNAQVMRIREYGITQTARLRDQYKAQQQNMLKLLELLGVGQCADVIEAECIKAESVIFDADLTFDFAEDDIADTQGEDNEVGDADSDSCDGYQTAAEDEEQIRSRRMKGSDSSLDMDDNRVVSTTQVEVLMDMNGARMKKGKSEMGSVDEKLDEVPGMVPPSFTGGKSSRSAVRAKWLNSKKHSPKSKNSESKQESRGTSNQSFDSFGDSLDEFPDIQPVEFVDPPSLTDSLGLCNKKSVASSSLGERSC